MKVEREYLTNLKYRFIYNALGLEGYQVSQNQITKICNGLFTSNAGANIERHALYLVRNFSDVVDCIFAWIEQRKQLTIFRLKKLHKILQTNLVHTIVEPKKLDNLAKIYESFSEKQLSVDDVMKKLEHFFAAITMQNTFGSDSRMMACLMLLFIPMSRKMFPVVIPRSEKVWFKETTAQLHTVARTTARVHEKIVRQFYHWQDEEEKFYLQLIKNN